MAGHLIRALGAIVIAGACLASAACTSSTAAGGSGAGASGSHVGVPVKNGTVVVRQGGKVICVMKVVDGKGTCKVPAAKFGVGTSLITAQYSGQGYSSSAGSLNYTVVAASTTTTLALSPATVSYGNEQAERFSVKVTGAAGTTPTGSITVRYNGQAVCTITLSGATGSCTLPAKRLPVGSDALTAQYVGDNLYRGSVSGSTPQKLTVTK
jgi:spore coat protein U-like protein